MSKPSAAAAGSSVLSYAASAGSSVASYLSPLIPASIKPGSSPSSSSPSYSADIPSNRDMDRFYHVKVRPLLDAVDQLRSLLQSEPIQLPTIVVVGDQSSGKCFARGTRLRLYNGDTIAVEAVKAGDRLMGDDGRPRTVTTGSLTQGEDTLYEIVPAWDGAKPFTVNAAHILVLVNNSKPFVATRTDQGTTTWRVVWWEVNAANCMKKVSRGYRSWREAEDDAINLLAGWEPLEWEVSVQDFLNHNKMTQARCTLTACRAIRFRDPQQQTLYQVLTHVLHAEPTELQQGYMAWWLGLWVTDGQTDHPTISQGGPPKEDEDGVARKDHHEEIMAFCLAYQRVFNEPVTKRFDKVSTAGWDAWYFDYGADSVAGRVLSEYGLLGRKHVPQALICDSVAVRQRFLAGIIDGDGHYNRGNNTYELPAKERLVCDGYKQLAATLGLRNSAVAHRIIRSGQTGKQYHSHRVHFGGDMWDVVQHCAASYKRCPRPDADARKQQLRDSRCYGFSITRLAKGKYFGFAVEGGVNRRFLLEDYTVTHNVSLVISHHHPLCCSPALWLTPRPCRAV